MQRDLSRELLLQALKKLQEFLMAVARVALSDHLSLQDFQGSEQGGGSVAFIVMSHGSAPALFQGRARLRAVEGLNLALFVHAEHEPLLRWIQIETYNVGQLLQKLWISRQLECFAPVRPEIVTAPDVADGGLADALLGGHGSTTPTGHSFGFGVQGGLHNRLDLLRPIDGFAAPPRGDFPKTRRAALGKAGAPQGYRGATYLQLLGDGVVGLACGRGQHNPAAHGDPAGRAEGGYPLAQLLLIGFLDGQGGSRTRHEDS